ncbi:4-amino-4-deoxy-L-arabinose-phospho-UDP flippase [Citrobacter freundii]|uniref:4-amino-4-deoxy-L-arabinose-phosphoundecaprenol flippase subunit ArnF n=1 Tax=Citrobacter sp. TBCS-14 TaxID=2576409 RepID=UPI001139A869|nr:MULTISPECIES: 4-amino-4-deoxy-L-arabinose-phosphoundecaprenol flippase subunit ArnF [Citrobacter]MBA7730860.1 4-amino-4-deoxy-L-arabinose-phospho-UDP flippase [Citrobacter freundii]QLO42023.1 4-amino-4-deoxy-L-arabinose-phospho-UDP flippase [Citrobacter freundii]QLR72361.1 4-amino-4-deoxy-L-arabinose-phospho-UDP flippase [Citrobacter freundii]QLV40186.1 4-amino-4-deoxy-L-arabinose-phospho-UDP flippase [Citrobacter freundii]QLY51578.1 4-amino-4-deoxy-L-arabinose-phospho-UDP flippase [Citroba
MGIFWGLCSVMITSLAQLSLGYAMDNLPPILHPLRFMEAIFSASVGTLTLYAGLVGYLLSVICWHQALHRLALSKAYALLSLSYVLVWLASMFLPGWLGSFSWQALIGVLCIMAGLMTIFLGPSPAMRGEKP